MKLTMFIRLMFTSVMIASFFSSCSKSNIVPASDNFEYRPIEMENQIRTTLKFANLEENLGDESLRAYPNPGINLVIVSFQLKSKRRDCEGGFGICDVKWFPGWGDWVKYIASIQETELKGEVISAEVQTDNAGNMFFEIPLSEPLVEFSPDDIYIKLDEDVIVPSGERMTNGKIKFIPKEKYEFSTTIGEYGGYRIRLKDL